MPESSPANADDRLPLAPLGRVEGGDGIVEGREVADVRPQPSVPHPLHDLTQLGTIGLDNEVDRQAARTEGIFSGPSTGANLAAAVGIARRLGPGHRVVTVQVDSGLKYLTGQLYA